MSVNNKFYNWFYAPLSANVAALYRIGLGSIMLLTSLLYATHIRAFFTDVGYITKERVIEILPDRLSLLFFSSSVPFANILYVLLIISCISLILGIYSRLAAVLCYVLFLSFYNRFPLIGFGGSEVLIIALFFTIFMDTSKVRWPSLKHKDVTVPGWPFRLLQLQVAMIYLFAGFTKIQSPAWMSGSELLAILNYQYATFNFSWLAGFPFIAALMNYFAIFAEISFPFLIWSEGTRRFILICAFMLQIGIIFSLNVTYFPEAMLAVQLAFLREKDLHDLSSLFGKIRTVFKQRLRPKAA